MPAPAFTVVVAGGRRRALRAALDALAAQLDPPPFHVVVVLDGPDDETGAAIVRRPYPFETMLLEQSRQGLHHARDLGASAARAERLLFLDESVLAEDRLLGELHAAHAGGAAVLQPSIAIDLGAPETVVMHFARRWVARRRRRLDDSPLRPIDLCATPLSMTIPAYVALREQVGAPGFSRPGVGEDFRLGYALNALGIRAELLGASGCALAIGETLGQLVGLSHEIGEADAALAAAAPANAAKIAAARAERWATSQQAAAAVTAFPARAAVDAAQRSARLLAEARRGVVAADSLDRLDHVVALAYWLGHGGHDRPPERPA